MVPAPGVPPAVRLVPCRAPVSGGPRWAGLGSAAGFPFHDPSMTRMNSWIFSSTKRATCSRRTVCRCWPAPSPPPWTRPVRRRRRSVPTSGGVTVVKAQVKTGGRGKAGGVKVAKTVDEAADRRRADPRHGHQGPHRPPGDDRPGRADRRGVLLLGAARPGQPHLPRDGQQGGRHGDRGARRRASRGPRPRRGRPDRRDRRRQGQGDRRRRRVRRRRQGPDLRRDPEAVDRLPRRGRDAGRGQPAGQDRPTARSSPSTAR